MFELFLLVTFLIICVDILRPSKSLVMKTNALVPLYDVEEGESLPDVCGDLEKIDA